MSGDRHLLQKWCQGRKSGDSRFRTVHWGCQRSSEAIVISGGREENWDNPVRYIVYVGTELIYHWHWCLIKQRAQTYRSCRTSDCLNGLFSTAVGLRKVCQLGYDVRLKRPLGTYDGLHIDKQPSWTARDLGAPGGRYLRRSPGVSMGPVGLAVIQS